MPTTPSSEAIGRRPPGTDIVGKRTSKRKGIVGPIGSLKVQDLVLAGLISRAFDVSVLSCVKRRNQPTANGTVRRPTEIARVPGMPYKRGRHAGGKVVGKAPNRRTTGASTCFLRVTLGAGSGGAWSRRGQANGEGDRPRYEVKDIVRTVKRYKTEYGRQDQAYHEEQQVEHPDTYSVRPRPRDAP